MYKASNQTKRNITKRNEKRSDKHTFLSNSLSFCVCEGVCVCNVPWQADNQICNIPQFTAAAAEQQAKQPEK